MRLNKDQKILLEEAKRWYNSSEQILQYSGGPGTGKSFMLNCIINELGIDRNRIAPMSFIGAAAIVMRMKGLKNAKTIHSWLYNPVQSFNKSKINEYFDRPKLGLEFAPKPLVNIDLIVIDEAGAVPYNLKHDIESRGIKIIASGDLDQLPPVEDKPAYLYEGKVYRLTKPMRFGSNYSIIYIANRILNSLPIHKGFYGNVLVIDEDELTNDMISKSDIIICGKNKTRDKFNSLVRTEILKSNSYLPNHRERLVCRKNNWYIEADGISLANGLVGSVSNFPDVGCFDGKSFKIDFLPDMLTTSFRNISCDYQYFSAPYNLRERYKYNKYNKTEKFEYAYCITTHISQGSQYANGIYVEEYLNPSINRNLNYTGITRFSNFVIYVKQKKKYY